VTPPPLLCVTKKQDTDIPPNSRYVGMIFVLFLRTSPRPMQHDLNGVLAPEISPKVGIFAAEKMSSEYPIFLLFVPFLTRFPIRARVPRISHAMRSYERLRRSASVSIRPLFSSPTFFSVFIPSPGHFLNTPTTVLKARSSLSPE